VLLEQPTEASKPNCDRDYTLGTDYASFLAVRPHLWMIQDAHDPNDNAFAHQRFAELQVSARAR
jgi:hypothetical protein